LGIALESWAEPQTTLYIVRHAEKSAAAPGNEDPSLSPAGGARAAELEHVLHSIDLRAVYVTPYRRTRETAAPIAKSKHLTSVEVAPESLNAFADSVFVRNAGQSVLLIGHSDTASTVLQFMRSEQGAAIGECDYDDLIVVSHCGKDEPLLVQHLHYGAAPARTPVKIPGSP
jgi:broad specificity phosphatase PhoE